jgi:geranylgeranyl pyrophosphate synthase
VTQAFSLPTWIQKQQERIEEALTLILSVDKATGSPHLYEAMRYATLGGGKRLRALLVYATGQALGAEPDKLNTAACAVELIHAYSLVHDDMPAMDDDDLRRGKPSCHKAYDEATALLVGDALQSLAFETLTNDCLSPEQAIRMIRLLAQASGAAGMAGGQDIDLQSVGKQLELEQLQTMHSLKTGALIRASVLLGALSQTTITDTTLDKFSQFADNIGLAFQVQDDVLDVIADTHTLGKNQGSDIAANKPTYPALLSLEQAQEKADNLVKQAIAILDDIHYDTQGLTALANYVITRSH